MCKWSEYQILPVSTLKCIQNPTMSQKFPYPSCQAAIIFCLDYSSQSCPLKVRSWHTSAQNSPIFPHLPITPRVEVKALTMVYMAPHGLFLPANPTSPTLPHITLPTGHSQLLPQQPPCCSLNLQSTLLPPFILAVPCAWYAFPPQICKAHWLTSFWRFLNVNNFPTTLSN